MSSRREFLKQAGICAGAAALGGVAVKAAKAGKRPNFIVFLTDDQPQNGVGCYGNAEIKTPNMDRLAAEGVLFENAFVTTAICCCSRASILTGQHMRRHGIHDFEKALSAAQFAQTYPVLLRKAGYRTAFMGKFAVGGRTKQDPKLCLPADQFDLWYGFPQGIAFKQKMDGKDRYLTTVMEGKAAQFLKEQPEDRPFCMVVALKEPHGPLDFFDPDYVNPYENATLTAPANMTMESFEKMPRGVREGLNGANAAAYLKDPARRQEQMRTIYGYISRSDVAVGRIMAALKERELDGNTVVIHTSDNGSFEGAHGLTGKWVMYEESIRVPLIVRDPRSGARGRRSAAMALNIDIAPTVLAMAGVSVPAEMQGMDLQPLLRDPDAAGREDWYYEHDFTPAPGWQKPIPPSEGVRTRRWKYIRYTKESPAIEQLFDLENDPHEEHDLAGDPGQAAKMKELRARCEEYRKSLV